MADENNSAVKLRWYQTWWGVALAGLGVALVLALGVMTVFTVKYWLQIKRGEGQVLFNDIYGSRMKAKQNDPVVLSKRKRLETADAPYLGNADAKIVIVEFVDFKCPASKRMAPIIFQLAQKYSNKVKILVRNLPFDSLHPGATTLAEIAVCANQQGGFWQIHNLLFDEQEQFPADITDEQIKDLADRAGLNWPALKECLADPDTAVAVKRDFADAIFGGAKGTPAFFVNGDGTDGVIPLKVWEGFLENL